MTRTTTVLATAVTAAISALALLPSGAGAAANMTPDYEVKLLMNPSTTLGSDKKPTAAVLSAFGAPSTVTKMNVQFLDTSAKDIYTAGWSPRIRKIEGESGFELTYKKRYPVGASGIDGALSQANSEGFDASDTNYDAQIEWGYQKQTLSISRKKDATKSGYSGMDLPNQSDSRSLLSSNAPGKFVDWLGSGWGTTKLASSRIFGPVLAKRSVGTWKGRELDIEVWPIKAASGSGTDYIVEASFKTTSRTTASADHDALQAYLQSKGWFLAQDSLKTQQIMDRY
jgi:hypothetical protein